MQVKEELFTIIDRIDLEKASVAFSKEGFIVIYQKPNVETFVSDAKQIISAIGKVTNGKKAPLLTYVGDGSFATEETRRFAALKDSNPFSKADAYIISSTAHTLLANFFMLVNKPSRPTRFFESDLEAVKWLKNYL